MNCDIISRNLTCLSTKNITSQQSCFFWYPTFKNKIMAGEINTQIKSQKNAILIANIFIESITFIYISCFKSPTISFRLFEMGITDDISMLLLLFH